MATLLQFSRNIRKRGSDIENASVKLVKRVCKKALVPLVMGTPVDEGHARSNWRVSIGNPTRSEIGAYAPGKKLGIGESSNASAAISAGFEKINQLRVGAKAGTGQAGSAVFITNAIPYLDKLRNGHSKQQPNDWVALALLEAQAEIAGVRLLERGGDE